MSYIQNILADDEKVVYQAKISKKPFLGLIISGANLFFLSVLVPLILHIAKPDIDIVILIILGFIFFIDGIILFFIAYNSYNSIELAFTNRRVIGKKGKRIVELNLNEVESIHIDQSTSNVGSVTIPNTEDPQALTFLILDPMKFRDELMEYIRANRMFFR